MTDDNVRASHPDAAVAMRHRLAMDLRGAMKTRDAVAVATLRTLIGTLDNAGAVEVPPSSRPHLPVVGRAADVPRRALGAAEVQALLEGELADREKAAAEYRRLGRTDEATRMDAERAVIARYVAPEA